MIADTISTTDFCYSIFSGRALYKFRGILEESVFKTLIDSGKHCPVVVSQDGNSDYWIKRIRYVDNDLSDKDIGVYRHYLHLIKNRPAYNKILWPIDLVEVSDDVLCLEGKGMTVSRHHLAIDDANQIDVSELALLFVYNEDYRSYIHTAKDIVDYYNLPPEVEERAEARLTYKNPVIKKLIVEIVTAIKGIYDSGYIYYDFSLPRFSVDNVGNHSSLFLDFSNLIYGKNEFDRVPDFMIEEPKELEADFADPFFMNHDEIIFPDEQSFLFNLCSLLFYLMFGRYAYAGGAYMEDDVTLLQHYSNSIERLKNPFFIFDEDKDNNINKLGAITAHRYIIELFDEAPEQLKNMFIKTLSYKNAMRLDSEVYAPTLVDWMNFFEDFGWINESLNTRLTVPEN